MKKRLFSILLSLAMVITMMPAMASLSFAGEANTTVPVELVKATTSGSRAVKLSWNKVSGATKYVVYGQKCGKKYKKLITTSKTSYKVKKIKKTKLKAHKTYKFYVVAYKGSKKLVTSKSVHFITGKTMGKYANAKSIAVKPTKVTLKERKTATLKATTKIYKNKKHIKKNHGAATRFVSNNPKVASVNAKGVVTAKKAGNATIFVQDIGGLWCKTVVTVKKSEPPAPTLFTVTFDMQGHGTQIRAFTNVQSGTKITKPSNPTETGYTFGGWYKEAACTNAWNFDTDTVTADTTLYAKWTVPEASTYKFEVTAPKSLKESEEYYTDASVTLKVDNEKDYGYEHALIKIEMTNPIGSNPQIIANDGHNDYNLAVVGQWGPNEGFAVSKDYKATTPLKLKFDKAGEYTATFKLVDLDKGNKVICESSKTITVLPQDTAFKAVYNTTGGANTLTFYYDAVNHSGEGTVYDNLPTAATKTNDWGYNDNRSNIKSVVIDASVANYDGLTSTRYMFQSMTAAESIEGAEYLDVSNVTDMAAMFWNFGSNSSTLNSVPDVKDWNTVSVTNIQNMFMNYGAGSADFNDVPDVSKWNTASVTNMTNMFSGFGSKSSTLNSVPDVKDWNTAIVTNMNSMFESYGKSSNNLNKVPDVSKWNTDCVTNMGDMFNEYGYTSTVLNTVPIVNGWNTSNVTTMTNMFQNYGYSSNGLSTVPNVSNWKTDKVTSMANMFNGYGYTSTKISCVLDLSGWDLSIITSGTDVFKFNPETFNVKIPAKTGQKSNEGDKWYYGDGTNSIAPPTGKTFTLTSAN